MKNGFIVFEILFILLFILPDIFMSLTDIKSRIVVIIFITFLLILINKQFFSKKNDDYKNLKDMVESEQAYIIEAKKEHHSKSSDNWYIVVLYNKKRIKVNYLDYNKAFDIVQILLEKNKIPVDIYIYKNKKYVDLQNVYLPKIQGYDEAKKLVDEDWKLDEEEEKFLLEIEKEEEEKKNRK